MVATLDSPLTQTAHAYRLAAPSTPAIELPRNRFRKDLLHAGPLDVHGEWWDVKPVDLDKIAANSNAYLASGRKIHTVWDHDDTAKSINGDVLRFGVTNDRLWADVEITDSVALSKLQYVDKQTGNLTGTNGEVSIYIERGTWVMDGRDWAPIVLHVGIVNHPVVPNQQPFFQLSKGTQMAKDKGDKLAEGEGGEATGDTFSVSEVVSMFEKAGIKLAKATTKEAFASAFEQWAMDNGMGEPAPEEQPAEDVMADMAPEMSQLSMPARFKAREQVLLSKIAAMEAATAERDKAAFMAELDALCEGGKLEAKSREGLLSAGSKCGYELSLLSVFRSTPQVVPVGQRLSKTIATADAPSTGGIDREAVAKYREEARAKHRAHLIKQA